MYRYVLVGSIRINLDQVFNIMYGSLSSMLSRNAYQALKGPHKYFHLQQLEGKYQFDQTFSILILYLVYTVKSLRNTCKSQGAVGLIHRYSEFGFRSVSTIDTHLSCGNSGSHWLASDLLKLFDFRRPFWVILKEIITQIS